MVSAWDALLINVGYILFINWQSHLPVLLLSMKIKYETPYLRYQPQTFEVIESTKNDTKTTLYGPDYRDAFENEVKYYHDCIVNGTKPKSDFSDAMADLKLFRDICMKIKE